MRTTPFTTLLALVPFSVLLGCAEQCWDLQNNGACNHDQCYVPSSLSPDETGGTGDTGDGDDQCTDLSRAQYAGDWMSCGGYLIPSAEHCTQDAVGQWDATDYDIHTSHTMMVKYDRIRITPVNDPGEPNADFWTWSGTTATAMPGVVEHPDELYGTMAAFASKGCCPQRVIGTDIDDWIPHHPDCQSGRGLNDTPMGWCLEMDGSLETALGGGCVFPCSTEIDCPELTSMFCDLARPDPMGQAPGVCRYKSMPTIPTQLADIGMP